MPYEVIDEIVILDVGVLDVMWWVDFLVMNSVKSKNQCSF